LALPRGVHKSNHLKHLSQGLGKKCIIDRQGVSVARAQPFRTVPKRGGRRPRQKGNRTERALRHYLLQRGLSAERVPLSGSAGGRFAGDLLVRFVGRDLVVEVKARGNGFAQLYGWLDGPDLLIVKADRREPLMVLPLSLAVEIAALANGGRHD